MCATKKVNVKQVKKTQTIAQGAKSGELTKKEAITLGVRPNNNLKKKKYVQVNVKIKAR